jgi:hypothetical protein
MNDSMRLECIKGYQWPPELLHHTRVLDSFAGVIHTIALLKTISHYNKSEDIIVTLVSKEYLHVGKLWLSMIKRLNQKQYIVIAADAETAAFLNEMQVPNCCVSLQGLPEDKEGFVSPTGFTEKGLAISALKFPFVRFILEQGFHVLLLDIDALLLQPVSTEHFTGVDIAFQRIVYFPPQIAEVWGFAACGGCFWFRSSPNALNFINKAIDIQRLTYDDQIALNIALWESNITWTGSETDEYIPFNKDRDERMLFFGSQGHKFFNGTAENPCIKVRALSPATFWRNDLLPFDSSQVVVFHPNSPKTEAGKLDVFRKYGFETD